MDRIVTVLALLACFLAAAHGLEKCFSCKYPSTSGKSTCKTNPTVVECKGTHVCAQHTIYQRENESVPFDKEKHFIFVNRYCQDPKKEPGCQEGFGSKGRGMCIIGGPNELNCIKCCSTDKCNNGLLDWTTKRTNGGVKASATWFLVISLVAMWFIC